MSPDAGTQTLRQRVRGGLIGINEGGHGGRVVPGDRSRAEPAEQDADTDRLRHSRRATASPGPDPPTAGLSPSDPAMAGVVAVESDAVSRKPQSQAAAAASAAVRSGS